MKNKSNTFFVTYFLLLSSLAVVSLYLLDTTERKEYTLTKEQKQKIISQIKMNGLINMNRVGCEGPVAEFINTGKWTDDYCYKAYSNLELK